ncbi:hypothetical protein BK816_00735 [Boudabousia tangfeifanii]|uniref:Surface-anchored protein n=1 Tax=Boudabousia tangfeifanii TaxID=1912795 RepID=A0A1D9MI79_9ACTO|nr:choice-of-anchor M domain-containing protein [Boudabousia tangfeifanii]AOZ72002.1 hypothetical protein BK816_00735 [Boudabousia tangfeifanii]
MQTMARFSSTPPQAGRGRHALAWVLTLFALVLAPLTLLPAPAASADELDQTVNSDEQVSDEPVEIAAGHMDIGPRLINGKWEMLVRDDSGDKPVWRNLDKVVFRVGQAAMMNVPEDGAYSFTGAKAGAPVHVIPQSQIPNVPWLGWNTQSPEVVAAVNLGVNLTFLGAQGPANVSVYLESGNFSKPIVLWNKATTGPQPIWVDLNTHTHATWVFNQPGVYLMAINASAQGKDGQHFAQTKVLRFAVGNPEQVSTQQAMAEKWPGEVPAMPADLSASLAGKGGPQANSPAQSTEGAPAATPAPDAQAPVATTEPGTGVAKTAEPMSAEKDQTLGGAQAAQAPAQAGWPISQIIFGIGMAVLALALIVFGVSRAKARKAEQAAAAASFENGQA